MAKTMRSKKANAFIYILLGLLIVGLMGFGINNFGGSVASVARVGDVEITADEYARALQQDLQQLQRQTGLQLSVTDLRSFGRDQAVMESLLSNAALRNEAGRLGLSIGDARLFERISSIEGFQSLSGGFDRDAYRLSLRQQGLSVAEFEDQMRSESAAGILQVAIVGGVPVPDVYSDALMGFLRERRSFEWARLGEELLSEPLAAPTAGELTAYYEANPDAFTLPEARRITYAWLTPGMLAQSITVTDEELQALYDRREAEYVREERRIVDRLIYPSEEAASAARARLDAGEATFQDLVEERGLQMSDVDLGDVIEYDLSIDAGELVFGAADLGVIGPVESEIGPALFRLNAILASQTRTLEDVRDELRAEIVDDRARREILDNLNDFDDLLAGGATIEQLADETPLELGTVDLTDDTIDGIAGYDAFRNAALQATATDFPELLTLADGGVFALRLDEIIAPRLQSEADVADELRAAWQAQATREAIRAIGEAAQPALETGGAFSEQGLTTQNEEALTRDASIDGAPVSLMRDVFEMEKGKTGIFEDDAGLYLIRLNEVLEPAAEDDDSAALREAVENQARSGIAQDLFDQYGLALQETAGIELDQRVINAVQTQLSTGAPAGFPGPLGN